jgi:hypothetical protein
MKRTLLSIASGIFALAASSHAELIAWYQFDEDAGATTALNSVPGSTGVIGSNVTTGVPGIAGNAYSFTGGATQADIVDMGDASFLDSLIEFGQLTFSAWIQTTDTTGNRNTVIFAGSDTVANSYTDLGVAAGQAGHLGEASARNRPSGSVGTQQTGIFSDGVVVNDGLWHNLVMTVDLSSATMLLYVDGILTNGQAMALSLFPDFNNFEVGRLGRQGTQVDGYQGLIDNVQVYNNVLTDSEILYIYQNPGMAIPEPSTYALMAFGLAIVGYRRFARKTA